MKKILITVVAGLLLVGLAGGTALASNAIREETFGFSVGIASDDVFLSGRYFMLDDLAILGGTGFNLQGGDRSESDFGLFVGMRKYLTRSDFAVFVGALAGYAVHGEEGSENDAALFRAEANGGAEYFFDPQFSVEGSVGVGLRFGKLAKDDVYSLGTFTHALAVNFYF
jgi:hypothetical protein